MGLVSAEVGAGISVNLIITHGFNHGVDDFCINIGNDSCKLVCAPKRVARITLTAKTPSRYGRIEGGARDLPRFSIPRQFRAGIVALSALPADSYASLLAAVKEGVSADTPEDAATHLQPLFPSFSQKEVRDLVLAVGSLQTVHASSHSQAASFASDINEALAIDDPSSAKMVNSEILQARIKELLQTKMIHITSAKARELRTEVERYYCTARILTDMRPIFAGDNPDAPRGIAILHTLQIGYHEGAEGHKEFYVTLDDDDLASMKEVIERAEKKKRGLKETLSKADLRLFE